MTGRWKSRPAPDTPRKSSRAWAAAAIFEAARILNQFYETLRGEEYLTFNPSVISGGTEVEVKDQNLTTRGKTNVVPAKVIVRGDLRFIREEQKEAARTKMREIVAKSLPGATATITFADGIPAMSPSAGNYNLLKQLDAVSQDLGFEKDRGAGSGSKRRRRRCLCLAPDSWS